jgi:S1-C subfamily serine protease
MMAMFLIGTAALLAGLGTWRSQAAEEADKRVLDAETQRVAVIERIKPTVVAIFANGGQGGGSGVLVSQDGYALTNFHVVEGSGPVMQCGLPDGVLYDAVLVGLDKVGDVALIKLLPQKAGQVFPYATMGDSDTVKAGDWSLALGNPFLLATDFHPTVTYGLVSGVHRYQYPAGTLLEYTDCIQVETSINPGNSGGPLFNMDGQLIGINGRGSFEKRGRVNSGVGYAISINQIKNFMGHLRGGLDTDHATLGATIPVYSDLEEGTENKMVFDAVIEDSDAHRRGLDAEDELVSFAGRMMSSVNQYKNVLGLFPKGWRVPLVYRRKNEKHEILVRLMQLRHSETPEDATKPKPQPGPPRRQPPIRKSAATALYEPKPGFANYHFNKIERDRLLAAFRSHGDFATVGGDWVIESQGETKQKKLPVQMAIREELEDKDAAGNPVAQGSYHLKPDMLPPLPVAAGAAADSPYRQAVVKAAELLKKHAKSFPQEFWAQDNLEKMREHVFEVQKDVSTIQVAMQEALDELQKVAGDRGKESSRDWQAAHDYTQARLSGFLAYVYEYNFMLGQLRKDPLPPRDPKIHRGWRMDPQEKLRSGPEARKLAGEAEKIWDRMVKDYEATKWVELARKGRKIQLGLQWVPTGGTKTVVRLALGAVKFDLDPLKVDQEPANLKEPRGSGGLLEALYQYRRFLTLGASGFEGHFSYGGYEPFYPPPADGKETKSLNDWRVDAEVMLTEHAAVSTKWYFSRKDQTLLGFEVTIDKEEDPCEVYLSEYKAVDGRQLPHRFEVRYGNDRFGVFTVNSYKLAAAH